MIPPLPEQNEIVAYLDRKVAQIDKMKAAELTQINKLKEYKQRLISDVVTGKVKVTNE
jgi:restriction endonuclease S subunit